MEVFQIAPAGTRTLLFLLPISLIPLVVVTVVLGASGFHGAERASTSMIPMETTGSLFNIFPKILLIATIMKCRIDEQCGSPSTLTHPSPRGRGIY